MFDVERHFRRDTSACATSAPLDEEEIVCAIAYELGLPDVEIALDTRLVEDLGLDRFDVLELIEMLEIRFGLVIGDEEASRLDQVGEIVSILGGSHA